MDHVVLVHILHVEELESLVRSLIPSTYRLISEVKEYAGFPR